MLEFIGANQHIENIILIIAFLALMTFMDYLIVNYEKGGMLMISMIKVSTSFAISYIAGIISPVFS